MIESLMKSSKSKNMITWEQQYLDLVQDILRNGDDRVDRTGVGTRAVFGRQMDIDLSQGFPAVTTKKLAWKAVVSELLWFIEGSTDERRLAEILHGTRDPAKKTIWTDNAEASYWKPKARFEGDLGPVYGNQWRRWLSTKMMSSKSMEPDERIFHGCDVKLEPIDQLAQVVTKLKTNPTDRRMIISAWNVAELNNVALPPCHMMAQFFVEKGRLSCSMYQRSVDTMLGLPFNIASYALLVHLLAQVTDLKIGRLIMNLGDTHIYSNHLDGAKIQLDRTPTQPPFLLLNPAIKDIDSFTMRDIGSLCNYNPQESIKMEMAV